MINWFNNKKKIVNYKVEASSILEVTTAMILVGIIFVISSMIYFNLSTSNKSMRKLKVEHLLNHLALENITNRQYLDQQYKYETFTVHQQVTSYKKNNNLLWFQLEAIGKDGKVIATHNCLVYEPNK